MPFADRLIRTPCRTMEWVSLLHMISGEPLQQSCGGWASVLLSIAFLAHAPRSITDRHYDAHDYEPEKRAALEALARHVMAIGAKASA